MARFTPRTTEREMRSAWWDIKESEYLNLFRVAAVVVMTVEGRLADISLPASSARPAGAVAVAAVLSRR